MNTPTTPPADTLTDKQREHAIYRVTIFGGIINMVLLVFKFLAGVLGHSSAMIADAVHSFSDFLTDIVVLVFVKISNRPADHDHAYGHGKYETLATFFIGLALLAVGGSLAANGIEKIVRVVHGEQFPQPGWIAFAAAIASILLKELTYQVTARVGKRVHSDAVIANAWHHRSDAFSSIGTALGIGGAIVLGRQWTVLDPIAAVVVSVLIIVMAAKLVYGALGEFLEKSLPDEVEQQIIRIVQEDKEMTELHHLRTRSVGNHYAIEMHLRMRGDTPLYVAHQHATRLEQRLKQQFGQQTHVGIHIEPLKVNGQYAPCDTTCDTIETTTPDTKGREKE